MQEKPLSLRFLKLFIGVWWWSLILIGITAIIWIVSQSPENIDWAMVGYASEIDTSALQATDRDGQPLAVEFDGPARLKIGSPANAINARVGNDRKVLALLFALPIFGASLYFVKQLRDIVQTMEQHDPFVAENAQRVRTIGVLILVFAAAKVIGNLAVTGYADSMVIPSGFNLDGRLEFPVGLLVVGIAVIVLSEVFRHGSNMREDQSLTI